jgi:AdoMet-dependent heme synthase
MPHPLIRTQKYDRSERPFLIIWETTQACGLACRHCRAQAQPLRDACELTFEQGKMLLEQARDFGKPSPIFIFTGGDPFERPDLFDLVRYGSELGLAVAVSPSGTPKLTRENLIHLKEAGAKAISLSIDGSTPELHDDFRQVPGSYDLTLRGWKASREIGLKLQVNTTATRYNLEDLPSIFRLVQDLGAMTWSLFFLVPTGRGRKEDEISASEYEAVLHFLYDVNKLISAKHTEGHHFKRVVVQRAILEEKGLPLEDYFTLHPIYYELKEKLDEIVVEKGLRPRQTMMRTPMHINAADGFVFISHLGEVFPSGFLPLSAGNVKQESLVSIYRNAPLFRDLRDPQNLGGRCGRCEFVPVCGGSRSRAYAVSQDPFAEEPFCTHQPASFPFPKEVAEIVAGRSGVPT